MRKFNKSVVLFGVIFCIMLIVGCVKFTTTPITPFQPSGAQEPLKEANPSQATPSAAPPSVFPSPSTTTPTKQITDITAVKCDSATYNLVVKPNHELIEISIPITNEQSVLNLKLEGVVENIVEVAKNDGNTQLKLFQVYGDGGKASGSFLANWAMLIADVKRDNLQTLYNKMKEKSQGSYGISGLNSNYKEQDVVFDYMCKVIIPKNTGRITLYSNIPEASFTVKGPAEYSGSGACWAQANVPLGQYQVVFDDVQGYEFAFSSLDKKQTAFVDASFLRTVDVEYKKIGEES